MTVRFGIVGLLFGIIALTVMTGVARPAVTYSDQVAVLMYHHVHDKDTSSSTVPTKLFHDQLSYLQSRGYHFISMEQFTRFMSGAAIPDKAVLVTFDDGYQSFYQNAYPILRQLNIPAVNFVITQSLDHPQDDSPPKLSRDEIQAMKTASPDLIDIQCHTHAFHGKRDDGTALLQRQKGETQAAYMERIKTDTETCQSSLQPLLAGKKVEALAYPFGIYDSLTAEAMKEAGIRYAFTISPRMATRDADELKIPRINAGSPGITPEALLASIERQVVKVK